MCCLIPPLTRDFMSSRGGIYVANGICGKDIFGIKKALMWVVRITIVR